MRRRRHDSPAAAAPLPASTTPPGVEFAWHVHTAQEAWTAKADGKASILLALEGGALFALASGNAKGGLLTRLHGWHHTLEAVAVISILLAVGVSIFAVVPLLGRSGKHKREYRQHMIYFGHLRYWAPSELAARLEAITTADEYDMLAQQMIEMSKVNWRKHRRTQVSLIFATIGIITVALAVLLP